jgi:hypothetical protein
MQYNTFASFNDILYLCNFRLVAYNYKVDNCLFDSISYLLTSFQMQQNVWHYIHKKHKNFIFQELNPSLLYNSYHGQISNEYQYIEKNLKVLLYEAYGGILE